MSDTSPKNQDALTAGHKASETSKIRQPGELLYEFVREDHRRIRCELRDDGPFGFDVQIFKNEEFAHSWRWPNRAMAEAFALAERERLELEGRQR